MPDLEIKIPPSLMEKIELLAAHDEIDVNTWMLLAIAERVGAQKEKIFQRVMSSERHNREQYEKIRAWLQKQPLILDVKANDDITITVIFDDGMSGIFDMKGRIDDESVFRYLHDLDVFRQVHIENEGKNITWSYGVESNFEIDAQEIYWNIFLKNEW